MAAFNRLIASPGNGGFDSLLTKVAQPLFRLCIRSYGISATTAALPQFDYDRYYYYNSNNDYDSGDPSPAVDAEDSTPLRGVRWVFIGSPNAKKHIYAGMISKLLEIPHISITSLLRQDLSPRSPIYRQIAEAVNYGKPVPESIIFGLLSKQLEDGNCRGETGFILDGIPRTRLQAEILDQLVDIDLVVNFKSSEDGLQAGKSAPDSTMSRETKSSFSSRDTSLEHEDSVPNISIFHREQMKLLENYYQSQKKLIDIEVRKALGETWKGLVAALHLQHVNAVHSSRMLTMGFQKTLRF